jgi:hypothetical protein
VGYRRGVSRVLVVKLEGKSHLEDLSVDGRIILNWIFEKWDGNKVWINVIRDRDKW